MDHTTEKHRLKIENITLTLGEENKITRFVSQGPLHEDVQLIAATHTYLRDGLYLYNENFQKSGQGWAKYHYIRRSAVVDHGDLVLMSSSLEKCPQTYCMKNGSCQFYTDAIGKQIYKPGEWEEILKTLDGSAKGINTRVQERIDFTRKLITKVTGANFRYLQDLC